MSIYSWREKVQKACEKAIFMRTCLKFDAKPKLSSKSIKLTKADFRLEKEFYYRSESFSLFE
ncbi:hypothetical protein ABE28_007085 [Peribacillus muralis]|uniref:Uncharacterized protein n=1 Tax=Peribacillus muralis TaxID=264697 RepID=A0A1B3XLP6_9BACI|nr:hypothetical protein ABE28_007085 [Peribacillus muralis]